MKRLLAAAIAVLLLGSCAERARSVDETEEITETAETPEPEETTEAVESSETELITETTATVTETTELIAETSESVTESSGTLWETKYFTMLLKDGWEIKPDCVSIGGIQSDVVYYGEKAVLLVTFVPLSDINITTYKAVPDEMSVTDFAELIADSYVTSFNYSGFAFDPYESFPMSGKDGFKFGYRNDNGDIKDRRYYLTIENGFVCTVSFTLYDGYDGDPGDFDEMAKTFAIMGYAEEIAKDYGNYDDYNVEPLNLSAAGIANAIEEWIAAHKDDDGFPIEDGQLEELILRVGANGNFECSQPDSPFFDSLCETLSEEFPDTRRTVFDALIYPSGSVHALLYDSLFFNFMPPTVIWDWDNNKWIAEGALADGVDANGVLFGSYPPHRR